MFQLTVFRPVIGHSTPIFFDRIVVVFEKTPQNTKYAVDIRLNVMFFFSATLQLEVQHIETYGESTSNNKVTEKSMALNPKPTEGHSLAF